MENNQVEYQEEGKNIFKILSFILLTLLIVAVVFIFNKNAKIAELEKGVNEKIVYVNNEGEVQAELVGIKNNLQKSVDTIKEKEAEIVKLKEEIAKKEAEIEKLQKMKNPKVTTSKDGKTKIVTKYIKSPNVKYIAKPVYPKGYKQYLEKEIEAKRLILKYNLQNKSPDEILDLMSETVESLKEELKKKQNN